MLPILKRVKKKDGSLINIKLGSIYIIRPPFMLSECSGQVLDNNPSIMIAIPIAIDLTLVSFYVIGVKMGRHPVIEYYLRNSEVILSLRIIICELKPILKEIWKELRGIWREIRDVIGHLIKVKANKNSNKGKKPKKGKKLKKGKREENIVKICKEAIDEILKAMDTADCASITIRRRKLSLFNGRIKCKSRHIAEMRICYIKRLMDILKWPWLAILWWANLHLGVQISATSTSTIAELVERYQRVFISCKMNPRRPKESFGSEEGQIPTLEPPRHVDVNIDGTAGTIDHGQTSEVGRHEINPCGEIDDGILITPGRNTVVAHMREGSDCATHDWYNEED